MNIRLGLHLPFVALALAVAAANLPLRTALADERVAAITTAAPPSCATGFSMKGLGQGEFACTSDTLKCPRGYDVFPSTVEVPSGGSLQHITTFVSVAPFVPAAPGVPVYVSYQCVPADLHAPGRSGSEPTPRPTLLPHAPETPLPRRP